MHPFADFARRGKINRMLNVKVYTCVARWTLGRIAAFVAALQCNLFLRDGTRVAGRDVAAALMQVACIGTHITGGCHWYVDDVKISRSVLNCLCFRVETFGMLRGLSEWIPISYVQHEGTNAYSKWERSDCYQFMRWGMCGALISSV